MEQQARLRDTLSEQLKKEVETLKIATGEATTPTDAFSLGMHNIPYTQSSFFPSQPQLYKSTPRDPLGQLQGLDISSRGSHSVKSDGSSISASESSGTLSNENFLACTFSCPIC
ncbi:Basic-leucine zipper transcription factor family protein isoform 2 [Hibiscus syriacus]|uniref:Basic-leucine zipper transcription factor family protein isoform 2 n=1 Tax=Hibiscus syriacus TaxID=106335 RepID=A0A6A3C434_HIBSY|nr:Basic-leucine zipper transcription factor family protein isoform 2 [Hibiscus syriacus]